MKLSFSIGNLHLIKKRRMKDFSYMKTEAEVDVLIFDIRARYSTSLRNDSA